MQMNHLYFTRHIILTVFQGATGTSTSGSSDTPSRRVEWYETGSLKYSAQGGRDVLIIESDLPLSDPEVISRRPGDLTDANRQKLKSQGVSSDELHEASIIRARYEYDKRRTLFRVLRSEPDHQLKWQEVFKSITKLFESTKNDGGKQFTWTQSPTWSNGNTVCSEPCSCACMQACKHAGMVSGLHDIVPIII